MASWPMPTSPVGTFNKLWTHYTGYNWATAWNGCILGSPLQYGADVLSNCTGWAEGRALQLYMLFHPNYDPGTLGTHLFMDFSYHNAGQEWIDLALHKGFEVVQQPVEGSILVTPSHVAIVERDDGGDSWLISESGYGDSTPWYLHYSLYKGSGYWWSSYASDPRVIGFIKIPGVTPGPGPSAVSGYDRHRSRRYKIYGY